MPHFHTRSLIHLRPHYQINPLFFHFPPSLSLFARFILLSPVSLVSFFLSILPPSPSLFYYILRLVSLSFLPPFPFVDLSPINLKLRHL